MHSANGISEDGNESVIPMMKNAGSFHFQENEHFCAILFAGKYAGDGAD